MKLTDDQIINLGAGLFPARKREPMLTMLTINITDDAYQYFLDVIAGWVGKQLNVRLADNRDVKLVSFIPDDIYDDDLEGGIVNAAIYDETQPDDLGTPVVLTLDDLNGLVLL